MLKNVYIVMGVVMCKELQLSVTEVTEVKGVDHFFGANALFVASCLFQVAIFAFAGFWGILYSVLAALVIMWFCTTFGEVDQFEFQDEVLASSSVLSVGTQN
jgi:hypothetical protein